MTKKSKSTKPATIPIANTQWADHFRSYMYDQLPDECKRHFEVRQ